MLVNVPGPVLPVIRQIERLPGVAAAAGTVGLNANPVVNGKLNDAWLTNGLTGSLDGDGFRQDAMTVLAGRLPRPGATDEVALMQGQAQFLHTGVGGHVTYELYRTDPAARGGCRSLGVDRLRHLPRRRPGDRRASPGLLAGIVVLLVAGNLLAAMPGAVAARTPPAVVLRAE